MKGTSNNKEVYDGNIIITTGTTTTEKIWKLLQDGKPRTKWQVGEKMKISPHTAQKCLSALFMAHNNLCRMNAGNRRLAYYIKSANIPTNNISK